MGTIRNTDAPPICTRKDCDRPHHARYLCRKHYRQVYDKSYKQRGDPPPARIKETMPYYVFLAELIAQDARRAAARERSERRARLQAVGL